jgi:hypothetical protein
LVGHGGGQGVAQAVGLGQVVEHTESALDGPLTWRGPPKCWWAGWQKTGWPRTAGRCCCPRCTRRPPVARCQWGGRWPPNCP